MASEPKPLSYRVAKYNEAITLTLANVVGSPEWMRGRKLAQVQRTKMLMHREYRQTLPLMRPIPRIPRDAISAEERTKRRRECYRRTVDDGRCQRCGIMLDDDPDASKTYCGECKLARKLQVAGVAP